ncbi:hypothetical protein RBH26_08470 [Natronolimnohabitans sp. A-GB9]|uniref:DUF7532 family protein n=1 Tax=Natronolimnohabitans sp. A-GB9 TaxID=3069757 RepID=UPI0027AEDC4C|nr:hypothetical protein [Natronolimnohabitans sp. A-GB9]MDQ2050520.1 hypothetical protein [Natronolimnohabitans sp. A-GB9]
MHFDQRTQRALRDVGLDTDDLQAASQAVVEDGRILPDDSVELTLGPTIDDRVRFAPDRETLE